MGSRLFDARMTNENFHDSWELLSQHVNRAAFVFRSGDCTNIRATTVTSYISVCWNSFKDDAAGIAGFWAEVVDPSAERGFDPLWVDVSKQGGPVSLEEQLMVSSTAALRP
jgi:hypothetical protein